MYSWLRRNLSGNNAKSLQSEGSGTSIRSNGGRNEVEDEGFYGITDQLVDFVKSFTFETFKGFSLSGECPLDLKRENEEKNNEGTTTSGGVRMDLSEWQERHATLILSKVKELSQLRYSLCPRHLKERQFWRIYFTLVKSYLTEYELRAIRRDKLRRMAMEDEKSSGANPIELEMSEANPSLASYSNEATPS